MDMYVRHRRTHVVRSQGGPRFDIETPLVVWISHYFVVSNYCVLAGLFQYVRHGPIVTWETGGREEE